MFVRARKYNDLIEAMSREQSRHNETTYQRNRLLIDNTMLGDLVFWQQRKIDRLEKEAIARDKGGKFATTYNNNR